MHALHTEVMTHYLLFLRSNIKNEAAVTFFKNKAYLMT